MKESSNLDFIRSWAVLLVVIGHLFCFFVKEQIYFGFFEPCLIAIYGVAIFFVHTFLVLMMSLERQNTETGGKNLFKIFMVRRIFRIYPLSILAISVIALLKLPVHPLQAGSLEPAIITSEKVVANLLLVQNFFKDQDLLGPLWSLPYEIQMYLVLPLIFIFAKRTKDFFLIALMVWAAFSQLGVMGLSKVEKINTASQIYQIPYFLKWIPCFLPGAIAYGLIKLQLPRKIPFVFLFLFLVLSTISFTLSYHITKFFFYTLILGLSIPIVREVEVKWVKWLCARIAKYSYGIYLFHVPSIWVSFVYLGDWVMSAQIISFVGLMFFLPIAAYHAVEQPLIIMGKNLSLRLYGRPQLI